MTTPQQTQQQSSAERPYRSRLSRLASTFRCRSQRKPILFEARSSTIFILIAVSIAIFTDLFLYGVIVPVIPFALQERAGVAPEHVQYWVSVLLAVYGACLLVMCPIWGWVSDRTRTRRAPLLVGLVVLAAATVLLTVGDSVGLFIAGRALQGFSAAIVWVTGLALLVDTVGKDHIGQTFGYVTISMSLAMLLSPLLGGVVFDRAGYYAVFGMCFGLIGLDIVLRLVMIEKKSAQRWISTHASDSEDNDTNADKQAPMAPEDESKDETTASSQERPRSMTRTMSMVSTLSSSIKRPRLPPVFTLLKSARLIAALYGALIQASIITAFDSVLPIRVRTLFGWNSLGAGLVFLPLVVPTFLSPVGGYICDTRGPRWIAMSGFLFAVPFLTLLRLVDEDTMGLKVLLCALLALIGVGVTLALPPLMAEISYVVAEKEEAQPGIFGDKGAYAQAYGLFNMAFAGGCLVGPIWGGLIDDRAGWGTMAWTLALLSGTTALPIMLFTGGWLFGRKRMERKQAKKLKGQAEKENKADQDLEHADSPVEPSVDVSER